LPLRREEFVAGLQLRLEDAAHGGGDGGGVLLFDAAHHHAEVLGFEDDGDALGDSMASVMASAIWRGEALLHLQAAGEDVDEAGILLRPMTLPLGT
jgi:hypothetical protein